MGCSRSSQSECVRACKHLVRLGEDLKHELGAKETTSNWQSKARNECLIRCRDKSLSPECVLASQDLFAASHCEGTGRSSKQSTLLAAAESGDERKVAELLSSGVPPNTKPGEDSPLHEAAKENHVSVAKMLLRSKAKVDAVDAAGMTPLHWASLFGHGEIVTLLLEAGADLTVTERTGKTALEIAGSADIEQRFAQSNRPGTQKRAARHSSATNALFKPASHDCDEVFPMAYRLTIETDVKDERLRGVVWRTKPEARTDVPVSPSDADIDKANCYASGPHRGLNLINWCCREQHRVHEERP